MSVLSNGAKAITSALVLFAASTSADALIVWNWSFQGEAGTFTSGGTAPGNVAAAGTYTLEDFSVSTSALGHVTGSLLGGQYSVGGQGNLLPYDFNWNGSAVTFWNMAGTFPSDVWLFRQTGAPNRRYVFGADDESPQVNSALARTLSLESYGPVTVSVLGNSVGAIPEPAAWVMMLAGFGLVGSAMRRRQLLTNLA
jgi:hypothetical protein